MSMFDPNAFMQTTFDQALDEKVIPIPPGEYTAQLTGVEIKTWASKDGKKEGMKLFMKANITDPAVTELIGREASIKYEIMLDLTENGMLDLGKGKNIRLGQLRAATGMNTAGQPFGFPMLEGQLVKVKVTHRIDGDNIYNDIAGVAKA